MTFNTPTGGEVRFAGTPDSWGVWFADDPQQPTWTTFLDEVAAAGFTAIEYGPWAYLPTDPEVLRGELAKRDLQLVGVTVIQPLEDDDNRAVLDTEVRAAATLGHALGVQNLVLIESSFEIVEEADGTRRVPTLDDEGWARMVATITRVGEWVRDEWGMTVSFHPHADTYVESEAQIERLLDAVPEDVMQLCLDTGHHIYGGGEPVSFFRQHASRVSHLHVKDVDAGVLAEVRDEVVGFGDAVARGVMVEPGRGAMDFDAFRQALRDAGWSGWAAAEQDMYPTPPEPPIEIGRRTIAALERAGFVR